MFKNLLRLTCKEATFLASKKEENKTTFIENIKLKVHYGICTACKLFDEQTSYIGKNAAQAHQFNNDTLSEEKKKEIKNNLETH